MAGEVMASEVDVIARLTLIEAERDQLRGLVTKLARAVRDVLALHDPREASSTEAQEIRSDAEHLVALVELLPRTITPTA
jgi:hypothetical protein